MDQNIRLEAAERFYRIPIRIVDEEYISRTALTDVARESGDRIIILSDLKIREQTDQDYHRYREDGIFVHSIHQIE